MFLRGLPNLASKMKRPPKVKTPSANFTKQAGGDKGNPGNPDFYRISQISPLPLQVPSNQKARFAETKHDPIPWDVSGAHMPMTHFPTQLNDALAESLFADHWDEQEGSTFLDMNQNSIASSAFTNQTVQHAQHLSNSDLSYLTHQNRILLRHTQKLERQLAEANSVGGSYRYRPQHDSNVDRFH
jgi:hypothetical protein